MAFQGIRLAGLFFGCEGGHWEEGESGGYPVAQYLDGLAGSVGLNALIHHIRGTWAICISVLSVLPFSAGRLSRAFLVLALEPEFQLGASHEFLA